MAKKSAWCSIWRRFEYRPTAKPALPALEMAKNAATLPERLQLLLANDPAKDKAAKFLWPFLASLWNYRRRPHRRSCRRRALDRSRDARRLQLGAGAV